MSERSKASNELLTIAAEDEALNPVQIASLWRIADRIDAEMVELPKDRDGTPIHVDDLVYLDDGRRACVTEIDIKHGCELIDCWDGSKHEAYHPSGITRDRPDSLGRIADELDEMVGDASETAMVSLVELRELAERIRKLAKEGER